MRRLAEQSSLHPRVGSALEREMRSAQDDERLEARRGQYCTLLDTVDNSRFGDPQRLRKAGTLPGSQACGGGLAPRRRRGGRKGDKPVTPRPCRAQRHRARVECPVEVIDLAQL